MQSIIITDIAGNRSKRIDAIRELRNCTRDHTGYTAMHLSEARDLIDSVLAGRQETVQVYRLPDPLLLTIKEFGIEYKALQLVLLTGDLTKARQAAALFGDNAVAEALRVS